MRNLTITGNKSVTGGGVGIVDLPDTRVRIANSIISENTDHATAPNANNLDGRVYIPHSTLDLDDFTHNLIGGGSTVLDLDGEVVASTVWDDVNIISDAPHLAPLQYNGGPTPTHALLAESPAIDAGSNGLAKVPLTGNPADPDDDDPLETDQRGAGFTRIYDLPGYHDPGGAIVDIGAYEAGEICVYVTETIDEFDSELNFDDLSLREAVDYANDLAGVPTTICLPAGEYQLMISGSGGVNQGDLDVTGNVTIIGDGPGLSMILGYTFRIFDVTNSGELDISRLTLALGSGTHNSDHRNGGAVRVQNGGELNMDTCAVVGNETGSWGLGGGIYIDSTASGSIESSVITVNYADQQTGGLYLADSGGSGGTVTIESTIVANNTDGEETDFPDIYVGYNRTLESLGNNRFTSDPAGPGDFESGVGDYIKPSTDTVHYVVTSIADTYDGDGDPVNMSLRDAIYQANTTAGQQEIWVPAWDFVLTRVRLTDDALDVANGDLEITQPLTIRGISGWTSVAWAPGLPSDKVFELVGDYNFDGAVNNADGVACEKFQGYSGANLPWDGNDDGTVNELDEALVVTYFGTSLMLDGIL